MNPSDNAGGRRLCQALRPTSSKLLTMMCLLVVSLGCNTAFTGSPDGLSAPAAEQPDGLATESPADIAREIEEADIVKVVGDTIYVLNRFKGLLVIDASDPEAPKLIGELGLRGRGVEMYVVGQQAYVLLSADFFYPMPMPGIEPGPPAAAILPDGPMPPWPEFEGSQLAIVDLTDPSAPALDGKLDLAGFATESRRVGDVIYVVGGNHRPFGMSMSEDGEIADGFVASINVADPEDIVPVERHAFTGRALVMYVTESAIFAAGRDYDVEAGASTTTVQVIDISDSAGAIVVRGAVDVPGDIRNRFYMDAFEGVLRIATESRGFGFRQVRLFTYDLTDLDQVTRLGEALIIEDESLEAVRFDGTRGYVVTFKVVDPLFVVDLRDPTAPVVAGFLEVPGYSTHLEPRGNRLIAVGIDDTQGHRPALSYYDVEDPSQPQELARIVLGPPGSFTESEAIYDEKAFSILDEQGLIAIPFKHVDFGSFPVLESEFVGGPARENAEEILPDEPDVPACLNAVQLVDFDDDGLVQRGWFEHRGRVQRVGLIGSSLYSLSQVGLQTVDLSDRDAPSVLGRTEFFEPNDLPYYADDCGGLYGPSGLPPWPEMPGPAALLWSLLDGGTCGLVGLLPLLSVPACLCVARSGRSRRIVRR